jgi:hypothetical protein
VACRSPSWSKNDWKRPLNLRFFYLIVDLNTSYIISCLLLLASASNFCHQVLLIIFPLQCILLLKCAATSICSKRNYTNAWMAATHPTRIATIYCKCRYNIYAGISSFCDVSLPTSEHRYELIPTLTVSWKPEFFVVRTEKIRHTNFPGICMRRSYCHNPPTYCKILYYSPLKAVLKQV